MLLCEYKRIAMKRDMDLIRQLLFIVEEDPMFNGQNWGQPDIYKKSFEDGMSIEAIDYHLELLIEAGFLKGQSRAGFGSPVINKLTWEGHEFLDNIRDHGIWTQTKKRLEGLQTVALGVVAELAKAEIKKKLGLT
jgi:hypothetical protein